MTWGYYEYGKWNEYSQQPEQLRREPMAPKMQWETIYPDSELAEDHQFNPDRETPKTQMRTFATGATRDTAENKPDFKGYLSPMALQHFGRYMLKHQKQADGTMRASDNWKKGIPVDAYAQSFIRHTVEFWAAYEKNNWNEAEELLDAILFNVMGILHEREKSRLPQSAMNDGKIYPAEKDDLCG